MNSQFITTIEVQLNPFAKNGRIWTLIAPLIYQSAIAHSIFEVPIGFDTDFESIPRYPFIYEMFTSGNIHPSAIIHDYLYRYHRVTRRMADAVLYEALRLDHVSVWKTWCMWAAVRTHYGSANYYRA